MSEQRSTSELRPAPLGEVVDHGFRVNIKRSRVINRNVYDNEYHDLCCRRI